MHRELVDRAKLGDEEAFDALARMVGDRCMAIAFRILRDADLAEDAAQAALITAWRELRTLRDPDRFEPWLHRILTHECYAEARRRASLDVRHPRPADRRSVRPGAASSPSTTATSSSAPSAGSPLEQRAVLVFHHYLGLSLPEVADRLGIPLGTAKSRLHYATTALRASLEADARTPSMTQERPA